MNITILNNLDSRMSTTSWVSGKPGGSHMAFMRWLVVLQNQELGGTQFAAGMVGAR